MFKNIIKIFIQLIFILKILVFTYGCSSESASFMRGFLEEYNSQKTDNNYQQFNYL